MQLMVQIPSDRFNRHLLVRAQNVDVMFHLEHSTSDILTIWLTSYEWNTRMMCLISFFTFTNISFCILIAGNLFDVLKCCLELPNDVWCLPRITAMFLSNRVWSWWMFHDLSTLPARILALQTSYSDTSPTNSSPRKPFTLFNNFLLQYNEFKLCVTGFANESSIPASLAASRFDQNSSRHLSQFLETIGLSHYSGKR
jgi:hypothetical protein